MNKRQFSTYTGLLLAGAALPRVSFSQIKAGATAADTGLYQGADRTQKLIDGAKKEGQLNIYTSAQVNDIGPIVAAYEKKYGTKGSVWRSSSENVMQRALTEARAGRHTLDVIETNGPELEALHREKLLQQIKSPVLADLVASAIRPHGEWVATRLNVFVQAYNTAAIRKEDIPQTWDSFVDPKWKGKLGIEAEDQDWFSGILGEVGEARGVKLFKDIVAANGISVRKGHTLLTQLVASGEVPLAFTVYNYKAQQLKAKGAPIEWFHIGNAIARPNGMGIARRAPNPHAAVLFHDFMLGEEGQQILVRRDFFTTNKKVDNPLAKLPIKMIDPRVFLDEDAKWTKLYDEVFIKPR